MALTKTASPLGPLFLVVLLLVLSVCSFGGTYEARAEQNGSNIPKSVFGQMSGLRGAGCMFANCSKSFGACMLNGLCRQAALCNYKCQGKANDVACNLLCELTYGYNSSQYRAMIQCMSDHGCLPVLPPDGKCLAGDADTVKNLTDLSQSKGKWWILRGLNCGQRGWPAAFDYFPCQRDEFVLENGVWVDHIAYCGGANNTCTTPIMYTVANVSITKPGVITHWYTDPPLTPQIEEWRVLSWPHPDWMLYIYCGSTPTGAYAGGSVVSRLDRPAAEAIPKYVETIFKATALQFGFNYDTMCVSNVTKCSD